MLLSTPSWQSSGELLPPDLFQKTLHWRETKAVLRNSDKHAFREEWQEKVCRKEGLKGHDDVVTWKDMEQEYKVENDKSKPASPTKQTSRWMYQLIPSVYLFSAQHCCKLHICFAGSYTLPGFKCQSLSLSVTMGKAGVAGEFPLKSKRLGRKLKVHFWAVAPQSTALSGAAKSTSARTCVGALLRQLCCVWPKTATATSAPFGLITANLFLHGQK